MQAIWPLAMAIGIGWLMQFVVGPQSGGFASKVMLVMGINIILAVSLTVVNGFTGQFSLGHAGFMAAGGYAGAAVVYYGSMKLWGSADFAGGLLSYTGVQAFAGPLLGKGDVLFVVACLIAGLLAAAAGYVVGLPSLRLRGDYLAIVTLGFGEIVRVVLQGTGDQVPPWKAASIEQVPLHELPLMLGGPKGFNLLPTYTTLFWVYVFVVLTFIGVYRLKSSSSGRAFLSIREDEIAAQAMGVNITRYKVRAFVLSSFLAGMAGALYGLDIGAINASELGFQKSFDIIIMVVMGGMGSISGAALAAVILTMLPELLRDPPPVWPAGLLVLVIAAIVQASRGRWNWRPLLAVAAGTALLEWCRLCCAASREVGPGASAADQLPPRLGVIGVAWLAVAAYLQWRRRRWRVGPLVGIAAATAAVELMRWYASGSPINLADYRLIIYALLLIVMMILRPNGLFGVNEVWDYIGARRRRLVRSDPARAEGAP
jgi:branched-chain amino acid transport system permease protein